MIVNGLGNHVSLVGSFLPPKLVEEIEDKSNKHAERQMLAAATLLVNLVRHTLHALKNADFVAFDANAGDGGCQNQALLLHRIVHMDKVREEAEALSCKASSVKKMINLRKSNAKKVRKFTTENFFANQVGKIAVSKEMEYLLHARLLKVLKVERQSCANGVILTTTNFSKLSLLCKHDNDIGVVHRRKIMELSQQRLSLLSMERLREEALCCSILSPIEKRLVVRMLSEEHTHCFVPKPKDEKSKPKDKEFAPKTFGCLFYTTMSVLTRLKELKTLICLKSIQKEGASFHIVMRSKKEGAPFSIVEEKVLTTLSPLEPLITFAAPCHLDRESTLLALQKREFTSLVLTDAAMTAPYKGDADKQVEDQEAQEFMMRYLEGRERVIFTLHHIYLTTVGQELPKSTVESKEDL